MENKPSYWQEIQSDRRRPAHLKEAQEGWKFARGRGFGSKRDYVYQNHHLLYGLFWGLGDDSPE